MDAARQVYNACLGESLKRLGLLRQYKIYQCARKMKRGQAGTATFREARKQVQGRAYDLHAYAQQFSQSWLGAHLDSLTVQQYAFGKRGRPRFKGKNQLLSVEGKNNDSGIRWRKDCQVVWKGLTLAALIDKDDPVHQHGRQARVKYVRLLLRRIRGKRRFWARKRVRGRMVYPVSVLLGESLRVHVLPPEPPTFRRCGELSAISKKSYTHSTKLVLRSKSSSLVLALRCNTLSS
jgi:hypothetical protein